MSDILQTIFIVDDDEDVRDSLVELFESLGLPAKSYKSGASFLDDYNSEESGCLLTDVRMPGMSGIELQQKLNENAVKIPVVIMTGHGDVQMAVQAMKEGAHDFLQKPFRDQELIDCISKALAQDKSNRVELKKKRVLQDRIDGLTAREHEVIEKVLEGKANKKIARELDISDRTVEIHRSHAMEKLGVKSVAELVKIMLSAKS